MVSLSKEKINKPIGILTNILLTADWGWHCAMDYPKVKVYTVTQRSSKIPASPTSPTSPMAQPFNNPQFRGPRNHRHLSVERLYRLPFPDNHFDVVSARALPQHLKVGGDFDDYDRCLEECLRVLKPGGFLEFALFDHDIINPGPVAQDLVARFNTALKTANRDPEPTKKWITRLNKAGFDDIRRSWLCLPMAAPLPKPKVPSKNDEIQPVTGHKDINVVKEEEVRRRIRAWEDVGVKGSVADVAGVTGLLGGWAWTKWLQNEGFDEEEVTVGRVMDEAKERMSAFRCLVGWARKPL